MEVSWKIIIYYGRKYFYHRVEIACTLRSDSQLKFEKYDFKYGICFSIRQCFIIPLPLFKIL